MTQKSDVVPGAGIWKGYCLGVLLLFLVLAYTYVWTVQPRYGPDEPRHFAFVKRLVEKGKLPLEVNGAEEDGAITLHPPLYYTLMAPVYVAFRGQGERAAYMAIKHLSPLILLGALLLFLGLLRRLFPDRPFAVAAALAIVALIPEFQLEAAVMNNDSLAIFMGALFFWVLVRFWDEPPSARTAAAAGLVMAAFANTKATGLTLAPLWALALLLRALRMPERRGEWLRDLAIGYGVLLLLGTPWYVRNYLIYGRLIPIPFDWAGGATRPHHSRTGEILSPLEVYTTGEVLPLGWRAVVGLFQSYWGQVDWIREDYRPVVYGLFLLLVLAAAAGGILRLRRQWPFFRRVGEDGQARHVPVVSPLPILATGFALTWLSTWYLATFVHIGFYQGGRYLMPLSFAAGALLAVGWQEVVPPRGRWPFAAALAVGLVALNVLCLVELITVLNPRYVTPWPGG